MRLLRPVGVVAALAAPPLVLSALVWPDTTSGGDDDTGEGKPFEQVVDDIHTATVELDGATYAITLRPDMAGVCLEVNGPSSGSGTCSDLASMRQGSGLVSSMLPDGRTEIMASGLVVPDATEVTMVLDDEPVESTGVVADLPGRPEKAYVVVATVDANPPLGLAARFLDAEGDVVDEYDVS